MTDDDEISAKTVHLTPELMADWPEHVRGFILDMQAQGVEVRLVPPILGRIAVKLSSPGPAHVIIVLED